jgi:branched-chain amino acid transport system permease protein
MNISKLFDAGRNRLVITMAAVAVSLVLPFVFEPFITFQLTMAMVYSIAVLSIILLTGFNGQTALGHGAFFGMGAYITAILVQTHGWYFLATFPVAFITCFAVGVLIGIPALRLRGAFLAILTLTVAFLFPLLVKRFSSLTGGTQGMIISSVRRGAPKGLGLTDEQFVYLIALAFLLLFLCVVQAIRYSRSGRAIVAIRDNEIAAATLGVHLPTVKTITFGLSSAIAGLAGCLYACTIGFVAADAFPVQMSINFLIGAVIGGLYTIHGAIIGGLVLQYLPQLSQLLDPALTSLIYGVVLIAMLGLFPGGLAFAAAQLVERISSKLSPKGDEGERDRSVVPDGGAAVETVAPVGGQLASASRSVSGGVE